MKLNLKVSSFLFFTLTAINSYAQTDGLKSDSTSQTTGGKNSVYAELLGNAAGISLNYDRIILRRNNTSLSFSVGAGMVPADLINGTLDNGAKTNYLVYGIPISTNLFWRRRNSHFETGLGLTYQQGMSGLGPDKYSQTLFAVARIGYRYQRPNGGFFWKIGLTPFFAIVDFGEIESIPIAPLVGVAFGYTLKP